MKKSQEGDSEMADLVGFWTEFIQILESEYSKINALATVFTGLKMVGDILVKIKMISYTDEDYWGIRRAMKFSPELVKIANTFR